MRLADDVPLELLHRAKQGDNQAIEQVVQESMALVKAFVAQNRVPGYASDDVQSECLFALVRAVRTFDPTLATWRTYVNRVLQRAMIDLRRKANSIKGRGALATTDIGDWVDEVADGSIEDYSQIEDRDAVDERICSAIQSQMTGVRSGSTAHVLLLLLFVRETLPSLYRSVQASVAHTQAQPSLFPQVEVDGDPRPLGDVIDEAGRMLSFFERLVLRDLADGHSRADVSTRLGVSKALVDFTVTRVREDMEERSAC